LVSSCQSVETCPDFVAGIVSGLDLRQTPDALSVDLGDGVLDLLALNGLFNRAILDLRLHADELAFLERLGKVGEIAPGIDAVPFGADFLLALFALPALLVARLRTA
jgi:hypothetical protein